MSVASDVVSFVTPVGLRDPARPSGGNNYDLALVEQLPYVGWEVNLRQVEGSWPHPDAGALRGLADALTVLPDRSAVLLDGLVACCAPGVLEAEAERLRLIVLVHLPLAEETGLLPADAARLDAREGRALRCAAAVVAVSEASARWIAEHHRVPPDVVHTAVPGVPTAEPAHGTDGASELLCVASITPRKGHLVMVEALAALAELPGWRCRLVGSVENDPAHVACVRAAIDRHGLAERVLIEGPRTGDALDALYRTADVATLASYAENRPLAVGDALARGLPVLASELPGIRDALGPAKKGSTGEPVLPGVLVPVGNVAAWTAALRAWLTNKHHREQLRAAAVRRRGTLPNWHHTAQAVDGALRGETATHPGWPTAVSTPYTWPPRVVRRGRPAGSGFGQRGTGRKLGDLGAGGAARQEEGGG